jgi:hypothetical protein
LDPRTEMSPRSGPEGSTSQVSVTQTTVRARAAGSGHDGIVGRRVGGRSHVMLVRPNRGVYWQAPYSRNGVWCPFPVPLSG